MSGSFSPTDVRRIMLQYFYSRNAQATSRMGIKGSSVPISIVKKELKELHGLRQPDVVSNLNYLISQEWVDEKIISKQQPTRQGTLVPSNKYYYQISAAGIDKIEGEGEFTMPKFSGIKIEATGQNIITLGDGNKIDAKFGELGNSLVELRNALIAAAIAESQKMDYVADIDTIQSQLAKPYPSPSIIKSAWESVKGAAAVNGCATLVTKVTGLIAGFLA